MLVILIENQILAPQQVCPSCLLADRTGQPRWSQGKLRCGRVIGKVAVEQAQQYQCLMGFRVANIE